MATIPRLTWLSAVKCDDTGNSTGVSGRVFFLQSTCERRIKDVELELTEEQNWQIVDKKDSQSSEQIITEEHIPTHSYSGRRKIFK